MALTFRKVENIRRSLDRFKKANPVFKTDTGAIEKMINHYHVILKKLNSQEKTNSRLEVKLLAMQNNQNNLSLALKPFIKMK